MKYQQNNWGDDQREAEQQDKGTWYVPTAFILYTAALTALFYYW